MGVVTEDNLEIGVLVGTCDRLQEMMLKNSESFVGWHLDKILKSSGVLKSWNQLNIRNCIKHQASEWKRWNKWRTVRLKFGEGVHQTSQKNLSFVLLAFLINGLYRRCWFMKIKDWNAKSDYAQAGWLCFCNEFWQITLGWTSNFRRKFRFNSRTINLLIIWAGIFGILLWIRFLIFFVIMGLFELRSESMNNWSKKESKGSMHVYKRIERLNACFTVRNTRFWI